MGDNLVDLNLEGVVVGSEGRGDDDFSPDADPYYDCGRSLAGDPEIAERGGSVPVGRAAEARAVSSPSPSLKRSPAAPRSLPALLVLAARAAASSLELYPPSALGVLSECLWDAVVRARAAAGCRVGVRSGGSTGEKASERCWWAGGVRGKNHVGDDSHMTGDGATNTRSAKLPALAERHLLAIEGHPGNTHLARSKVADELLWRVLVEYRYPRGGINRPGSFDVPRDALAAGLRKRGAELTELLSPPLSRDEYLAEVRSQRKRKEAEKKEEKEPRQEAAAAAASSDALSQLFGEESDDDGNGEEPGDEAPHDADEDTRRYRRFLEETSHRRTSALRDLLRALRRSPMDVALLSETEIGRHVSKAVKRMKKLGEEVRDMRDTEKALLGYPNFWIKGDWIDGPAAQSKLNYQVSRCMSPLEFLQFVLRDWKDMAAEDRAGAATASPHPAKKRRKGNLGDSAATNVTLATCGRDTGVTPDQHQTDMRLLLDAPDWRSLHHALIERERLRRKTQGDRVRKSREDLERGRGKVGRVELRRAVGRVRGNSDAGKQTMTPAAVGKVRGNSDAGKRTGPPVAVGGRGVATAFRSARSTVRKEAILNKSRGPRSLMRGPTATPGGGGGSKISQLRQETRVATLRAKGTLVAIQAPGYSAFSAAVAGAGAVEKRNPVHMNMRGGKRMSLPTPPSRSQEKAAGVFSTLQRKKREKERRKDLKNKTGRNGRGDDNKYPSQGGTPRYLLK